MKYRRLGRTNLEVSEIGFGSWAIGGEGYGPTNDKDSLWALETAWENGVNFFDTADTYGKGHSESLIGSFLKNKPRDKIIIASKAGWDFYHGGTKKNFDPDYIKFACDESLKRLGVDRIDLYQLHNPVCEVIERGAVFDTLSELKAEGKIRFIGISIHEEKEAMAAIRDGRADTFQLTLNYLDQKMTGAVFQEAAKHDIGVIAREPLAFGTLSGKYKKDSVFAKEDHRRRFMPDKWETNLKKVDLFRSKLPAGITPAQAALEYVLSFSEVSTVIPGMKTRMQVLENLKAVSHAKLTGEKIKELRKYFQQEVLFREEVL